MPVAHCSAANSLSPTPYRQTLRIVILAALIALAAISAQAQKITVLHRFSGTDGGDPRSGVVRDSAGNVYGATYSGGIFNRCDNEVGGGSLFKVEPNGNTTILHYFDDQQGDGCFPNGLLLNSDGSLTGSTYTETGSFFNVSPSQDFTVFYNFVGGGQGLLPSGPLIRDPQGNLYGATVEGGKVNCYSIVGCGNIFRIDTAGQETVLYNFTGKQDGAVPSGGVIRDSTGNLYGTTSFGGYLKSTCALPHVSQHGCGTVFKLSPAGRLTVLYTFLGGADGQNPNDGLVMDPAGNLYGVTSTGGDLNCKRMIGCGTVFKIDPSGHKTIVHSFSSYTDGLFPAGTLTFDAAGNLYGSAPTGGSTRQCCGLIFKLDHAGNYSVVHRFSGSDGEGPTGGLVLDEAGNIYGTASTDSMTGWGTVFRITP